MWPLVLSEIFLLDRTACERTAGIAKPSSDAMFGLVGHREGRIKKLADLISFRDTLQCFLDRVRVLSSKPMTSTCVRPVRSRLLLFWKGTMNLLSGGD